MLLDQNKPILVKFKSEVKEVLGQLQEAGKQLQSEKIVMDLNTTIGQLDEEAFTLIIIGRYYLGCGKGD